MTAPDLSTYYMIHVALRGGARGLAAAAETIDRSDARRTKAFATYWKGYAGEVLCHHTVEDEIFFPALVEKVPVAADLIARTDAEHHRLDELMATSADGIEAIAGGADPTQAVEALTALSDLMDCHLDFEDADILPLFARHFTAEEYEACDKQAQKSIGLGKQAAFTIPFVASYIPADEWDRTISAAPMPFRVLYRLTRGRHERLSTLALGPARSAATTAIGVA